MAYGPEYKVRGTLVDSFPMGIDYKKFHQAALDHSQLKEGEESDLKRLLEERIYASACKENRHLIRDRMMNAYVETLIAATVLAM